MQAIETLYAGYRFRSRLEARFAVLFDFWSIEYQYEKEGFELPSGRYLPDFWLPTLKIWIEIKGSPISERERSLAIDLSRQTHRHFIIFCGDVSNESGHLLIHHEFLTPEDRENMRNKAVDYPDPDTARKLAEKGCGLYIWDDCPLWKIFSYLEQDIRNKEISVQAMRSARFEFGQKGLS